MPSSRKRQFHEIGNYICIFTGFYSATTSLHDYLLIIYLLKVHSPVNRTESPQGFYFMIGKPKCTHIICICSYSFIFTGCCVYKKNIYIFCSHTTSCLESSIEFIDHAPIFAYSTVLYLLPTIGCANCLWTWKRTNKTYSPMDNDEQKDKTHSTVYTIKCLHRET